MLSLPRVPDEAKPVQRGGGEREHVPMSSPFSSPLPEIEILPPPKAPRPSSRKRSSASKRSRKHSASDLLLGAAAPPPLPPMIPGHEPMRPPERSRRKKRRGIGPAGFVSPDADRAAHEVLDAVAIRMRRAQVRKVMSLSLQIFGLLAMTLVAYLVLRWQRPAANEKSVPEPAPVVAPLTDEPATDEPPSAVQPSAVPTGGDQPSDLPKS